MATPKQPRADRPKQSAERRSGPEKPAPVDPHSVLVPEVTIPRTFGEIELVTVDPRSVPVPSLPQSIQLLVDPDLKRRAALYWQDAHRLRTVLDIWQQWFRDLKQNGDADPRIPVRCDEAVRRCLEVLWPDLVRSCSYVGQTLDELQAAMPRLPSGRLAGKDEVYDSQAKTLVEVERIGWQYEPDLWNSFYGDLNKGCGAMYALYGGASEILRKLEHHPESFFRNLARPLPAIEKPPASPAPATTPPADPKGEGTPVDEAAAKAALYAALLVSVKSLADGSLKGIQRRVTVLLVEAGGAKAIADIATDKGVGWLAPFKGSVDGYLKGVRPKLQPLGADVKLFDQELRLVLQDKPTRPRRSTKKAAPPKRRQSAASLPPKRR